MSITSSLLAFFREVDTMFDHARTGRTPQARHAHADRTVTTSTVDGWSNDLARTATIRQRR